MDGGQEGCPHRHELCKVEDLCRVLEGARRRIAVGCAHCTVTVLYAPPKSASASLNTLLPSTQASTISSSIHRATVTQRAIKAHTTEPMKHGKSWT